MRRGTLLTTFLLLGSFAVAGAPAPAAGEPQLDAAAPALRRTAETERAVIRLADIAELAPADSRAFGHTILGLLPPNGRPLVLQRHTVQSRLQQIYGNSAPTLQGAAAVEVSRASAVPEENRSTRQMVRQVQATESQSPEAPGGAVELGPRASQRLPEPGVRSAVEDAIQQALGGREALWVGKPVWTDQVVDELENVLRIIEARATEELSVGVHVFHLTYRTGSSSSILPIQVALAEADYGLSVATPLRRGHVITASDFSRRALSAKPTGVQPYTNPADVIGKEVKQSIPTGGWLTPETVGPVTVVHRYDLVEVQVLAGGIIVTTSGQAKQDGAVGDLVNVETSDPKRTLIARVVGPSRVEIVTRPPTIAQGRAR